MVQLHDKQFELYLTEEEILAAVKKLAANLLSDYRDKQPILIPLLNGSFIFAADLIRELDMQCEVSFVKAQSYQGTASTGKLTELIGLSEDISGRHVILVEDIIDSGHTLASIVPMIKARNPASVAIVTLLYKPEAVKVDLQVDYIGISIPNDFIVGYGLDYDGIGRNLRQIYQLRS